jgi:DNA-binding LytR/AlgR family response regulator
MDGMTAARKLREVDDSVVLIFQTDLQQFAVSGYEVDALDYIVKPLSYPSFSLKIKKAILRCGKKESAEVLVSTAAGYARFLASSLRYVEVAAHTIIWHTDSGNFTSYGTLKEAQSKLNADTFFRCNSCYLVNMNYVTSFDGQDAKCGGDILRVSNPKRKAFMTALHTFFNGRQEKR